MSSSSLANGSSFCLSAISAVCNFGFVGMSFGEMEGRSGVEGGGGGYIGVDAPEFPL